MLQHQGSQDQDKESQANKQVSYKIKDHRLGIRNVGSLQVVYSKTDLFIIFLVVVEQFFQLGSVRCMLHDYFGNFFLIFS